jgi:hypothetical protein
LKVVSDAIAGPPVVGNVITEETMFVFAGMSPIALIISTCLASEVVDDSLMPLHDPVVIWRPLVKVFPAQLFMKLFCEVKDKACPTSLAPTSSRPLLNEPLWMALADSVVPVEPEAALSAWAGDGAGLA